MSPTGVFPGYAQFWEDAHQQHALSGPHRPLFYSPLSHDPTIKQFLVVDWSNKRDQAWRCTQTFDIDSPRVA
ncbi:hypothetical protein BDW62DRAFT_90212 [Aspergillus aurantiobrunneus]